MKIIDRIEEQFAVCEDSETEDMENIPLEVLPENIEEGDCLVWKNGRWTIDHEITEERRKAAKALLEQLLKK